MTGRGIHRRIVRNRKKNSIPLSKLRASDAAKTVVAHPRRLEELLRLLEDRDRIVRGRAAVALAQLSSSHPERLLRVLGRMREAMADDSAYVRWHILHALGELGSKFPLKSRVFLADLISSLEDDNHVCSALAAKALRQVAAKKPAPIEECFRNLKKEIPPAILKVIRKTSSGTV